MDAWTQNSEDQNVEDANNVEEDVKIEEKKVQPDLERAQLTEDPLEEFFTR